MRGSKSFPIIVAAILSAIAGTQSLPAQQKHYERTLLWEISGNGLPAPSYLYGTMHVQDKRAFDFGDSVLLKLHSCSIFASEVEIDSAIREVFQMYITGDSADISDAGDDLDDSPIAIAEPDSTAEPGAGDEPVDTLRIASRIDSIIAVLAVPDSAAVPSNGPPRQQRALRGNPLSNDFFKSASEPRPDDRPAILDAYLYRLARHEGKKVVGLESVDEQINAFTDVSFSDMWKFYTKRGTKKKKRPIPTDPEKVQALILDYYERGDLDMIHTFFVENWPPAYYNALLTNRNHHMADRAVPYMMQGGTFIAVGAGHLPGSDGLIELFRGKGYTVRPVKALRTGLAARYVEGSVRDPWFPLSPAAGAFSVSMPAAPIDVSSFAERYETNGDGQRARLYLWPDLGSGMTYGAGYIDYAHNYLMASNPERFLDYVGDGVTAPTAAARKSVKKIVVDGLPGREVELPGEANHIRRAQVLLRGNRLYRLVVDASPELIRSADADRFFNSFHTIALMHGEWRSYTADRGEFSIRLPEIPSLRIDTHRYITPSIEATFSAWDSASGRYYQIESERYSEYYQAKDSASFYDDELAGLGVQGDSTLADRPVTQDGLAGREVEVLRPGGASALRARLVVKGDRIYRLRVELPPAELHAAETNEFFDSFHLNADRVTGDLFTPKADHLLADLASGDSARRESATLSAEYFSGFTPEHLPGIYALIERGHPDDSDEGGMRAVLIRHLGELRDSSTLSVLRRIASSDSVTPGVRDAVLWALARLPERQAAELLVDMILEGNQRDDSVAASQLDDLDGDSATLHTLFPQMLRLFDRSRLRPPLYRLALAALDSGALEPGALLPYAAIITEDLRGALRDRGGSEPDDGDGWQKRYYLQLAAGCAGYLPQRPELQQLLASAVADTDLDIRLAAVLALIRQGKQVEPATLRSLAAEPMKRVELYARLERAGHLESFPKEFRTQQSIAEGLLMEWLDGDYDYPPDTIRIIGEREVSIGGISGRVYLFAFRYSDADDANWMVGISGPQPIDRDRIATGGTKVRSHYDALDDMSIDAHFDALLKDD